MNRSDRFKKAPEPNVAMQSLAIKFLQNVFATARLNS